MAVTPALARTLFIRITFPVLGLALLVIATLGVLRVRSASPAVVNRTDLNVITVQTGPMTVKVDGLGTLVPENVRWLSAHGNI